MYSNGGKIFTIFAGVNGAGKSTLYNSYTLTITKREGIIKSQTKEFPEWLKNISKELNISRTKEVKNNSEK